MSWILGRWIVWPATIGETWIITIGSVADQKFEEEEKIGNSDLDTPMVWTSNFLIPPIFFSFLSFCIIKLYYPNIWPIGSNNDLTLLLGRFLLFCCWTRATVASLMPWYRIPGKEPKIGKSLDSSTLFLYIYILIYYVKAIFFNNRRCCIVGNQTIWYLFSFHFNVRKQKKDSFS